MRRARMEGLRRNALIAIANGRHTECLDLVVQVMEKDPDPVVRATAVWTATILGDKDAPRRALRDHDPLVSDEARALLSDVE